MKKLILALCVATLISIGVFGQTAPGAPTTSLKVGDKAPEFTLNNSKGEPVKLSDFHGKKSVVLAFYVLAFTGG